MNFTRLLLEVLPLVAALASLALVSKALMFAQDNHIRLLCAMALCCTVTMMFAQVSWSWTFLIKGDLLGTDFANVLWALFNFWTMVTFAYAAHRVDK
jgi:hypothetical protein